MYLTYEEYQNYGGTLDETAFNDFEIEAEMIVNYYTFNRLTEDTEIPNAVKRLIYKIIGILEKKASSLSLGAKVGDGNNAYYIKSESNDGVSVTYGGMDSSSLYSMCQKEIEDATERYLRGIMNEAGRKLLYRGLYPGE